MKKMTNDEKLQYNIFHKLDLDTSRQKLNKLYGLVAYNQDCDISRFIDGKVVLDVGAGFGTLTKHLLDNCFNVIGIEPNEEKIAFAKKCYNVNLKPIEVYATNFNNNQFDCVILREVVFHLNFEKALQEINRICNNQIIIFQGNSIFLRKIGQKIYGHKEYNEKNRDYYIEILKKNNYTIEKVFFRDTTAFLLSGGFIGRQMIPNWHWLYKIIIKYDNILKYIYTFIKIEKYFCLRYIINAKKRV